MALGIQPAFVYKTFSYTEAEQKFRAVYILDHIVTDIRLRDLVIKLLMKLFPECDKACIDASRMFYGGKGLHSCQFDNRVNPFALFDTYLKQLELKSPSNFARARTNFLNDIGIAISETEIGVKFFDEFILENEEILVSTLIYKELTRNSSFSKVIHSNSIYSIPWDPEYEKKKNANLRIANLYQRM
jgi:hypothetical protein